MASSPSNVLVEQLQKINKLLGLMERRTVEVEQRSVALQDDVEAEYQRRFHNLAAARESAFSCIETLRTHRGSVLREQTEQLEQLVAVLEEAVDNITSASLDTQEQAILEQLVADLAFQLGQASAEINDVQVEFPAVQEVLDNDQRQYDDAIGDENDVLAGNVDRLLTLARTILEHAYSQSQNASKTSATVFHSEQFSKGQHVPSTTKPMSTFSFPQSSASTSYWLNKTKAVLSTNEQGESLKIKLPLLNLPTDKWLLGESDGATPSSSQLFANPLDELPSSQWLLATRQESSDGKTVLFVDELGKSPASTLLPSSVHGGEETNGFSYPLATLPASQWLSSGDTTVKTSDAQYSSLERCIWLMNDMKLHPSSKQSCSLNTFSYPLASAGIDNWLYPKIEQRSTKQLEKSPFHHIATAHSEKSLSCQWLVADSRTHDVVGKDEHKSGFSFEHILSSPADKWLSKNSSNNRCERAWNMGQWLYSPSSSHVKTEKTISWMEHIANTNSSQWLRGQACTTADEPPSKIPEQATSLTQWLLPSQNASEALSSVFEQFSLTNTKRGLSSNSIKANDSCSKWLMPSGPASKSTTHKMLTAQNIASLGGAEGDSTQQVDLSDKPEFYSWLAGAGASTPCGELGSETTDSEFEILGLQDQDAMMEDM